MRDFKIKAEWVASLKDLPQEIRCRVIDEIIRYGTLGDEPDKSDPVTFALVKSYTD